MNPDLWLVLMSLALVLPVMIVVVVVALTGKMRRSEEARYLPTLAPERDFWEEQDDPKGGGERRAAAPSA